VDKSAPFETGDDQYGFYEAECRGCDIFTRIDDVGLCEECAGKLDRDLLRQRQWDYSTMAYAVPSERREELRSAIIRKYGKDLELIAPDVSEKSRAKDRKGKGKRKSRGRSR